MKLALRFRRPDVDAFLRELSQGQLIEWLGFSLGRIRDKTGMSPASVVSILGAMVNG